MQPSMPAKSKTDIADWAMVAAIGYAPLLSAVDALLALPAQAFQLLLILATILITLALIASKKRSVAHSSMLPAGLFLALFLAASAVSTLRADIYQIRYDGEAMWRQLLMAMSPAILFWGARSWAARRFNVNAIDRGALLSLAVCGGSIVLELLGIARYEAYSFRYEAYSFRYFGFLGDQVAWILSFLAIYFLVRGRLIVLTFCLALLLATVSLGPSFIVAVGVATHLIVSRTPDMRSLLLRFGVLILGAAFAFLAQDYVSNLLIRLNSLDLFENDRTRTIAFTLEVFANSPVFGSGYNAHAYYSIPFAADEYVQTQWAMPVSTWAQILADTGIIGFIPFFIWAVLCCWIALLALRLKRSDPEVRALMGMAAWFIAYLLLNHSAAWLLPSSLVSPLVFIAGGTLVGATSARQAIASARPR